MVKSRNANSANLTFCPWRRNTPRSNLQNANTKSELKRSSLKTKKTLSLILKPPATYNSLQGLLLSLAKLSKTKRASVHKTTCLQFKENCHCSLFTCKNQLCAETAISRTVNAYRFKYILIWK